MLTLENISLFKNDKKIFSNLGFSISIGSALIIKGCNGSGKTSLLKIIAGISKATSGKITWGGEDINNFPHDFYGDMQFLGHKNFLKQNLTVKENLEFYSKLSSTEIAMNAGINFFQLHDLLKRNVKELSMGMQKKVMLAKLLCCPSTIWVLDEPSINLDENIKKILHSLIKIRIKEDGVVIIATHDQMFFDLGQNLNLEDYN